MENSIFVLATIVLLTLMFILVAMISLTNNKSKSRASEKTREIFLIVFLIIGLIIFVYSIFVFKGINKIYSGLYLLAIIFLVWFANLINIRDVHKEKIDRKYNKLKNLEAEQEEAIVLNFAKDRRFTESPLFYIKLGVKDKNGKLKTYKSLDRFNVQDAIYIVENFEFLPIKKSPKNRECIILADLYFKEV